VTSRPNGQKKIEKRIRFRVQKKSEKVVHFQTAAKSGESSKTGAKKTRKTGDAKKSKTFKMRIAKNDAQRPRTLYKRGTK
jgi:hypothetical protein